MKKADKEKLVIELYKQNKTIRQIAEQVHMSFKDMGEIIRRYNNENIDEKEKIEKPHQSKETKALRLFALGKEPLDVAKKLDMNADDVEKI